MSPLFLSRARLSGDAAVKALLPLLWSGGSGHSLIWSLFAGDENQKRDFLFRQAGDGWFYILSARRPVNANNLFDLDEPREFAPLLQSGDLLRFSLRANPVIRRRVAGTRRSKKADVVMDALRQIPKELRAEKRDGIAAKAAERWLAGQSAKHGFELIAPGSGGQSNPRITGYQQTRIHKRNASNTLCFSSLDFDGALRVTDPTRFHSAVCKGLGSAKSYGCGLMMIRRI